MQFRFVESHAFGGFFNQPAMEKCVRLIKTYRMLCHPNRCGVPNVPILPATGPEDYSCRPPSFPYLRKRKIERLAGKPFVPGNEPRTPFGS